VVEVQKISPKTRIICNKVYQICSKVGINRKKEEKVGKKCTKSPTFSTRFLELRVGTSSQSALNVDKCVTTE